MTNAFIVLDMTTADFFDTMGKRIRILRDDKRLNQTELAQRMAQYGVVIDPSYLSQIEGGTKTPRLPVLKAIAQALETTTDYLLLLNDSPFPAAPDEDEPDSGHGISEEAQRIANLVDLLPAWRRRELLTWLENIVQVSESARTEAREAAEILSNSLNLNGVLSPRAMQLIEAALLRYVSGRAAVDNVPMPDPPPAIQGRRRRPRRTDSAPC